MKADPAKMALMVHLATLNPLFFISVASTAPFWESNFLRQSILAVYDGVLRLLVSCGTSSLHYSDHEGLTAFILQLKIAKWYNIQTHNLHTVQIKSHTHTHTRTHAHAHMHTHTLSLHLGVPFIAGFYIDEHISLFPSQHSIMFTPWH